MGRFLRVPPRAVQGWTQLIGTFGFEIAEVRQIDLKGKTVCPSPDWCSEQNYMSLWHWARKKKSQILMNTRFATRMSRIFVAWWEEEATMIFFSDKTQILTMRGGKNAMWSAQLLGNNWEKKNLSHWVFLVFILFFFSACSVFDPGYTSFLFIAKRVGVCISYLSCSPAPCAQEQQHCISSALQFLQAI